MQDRERDEIQYPDEEPWIRARFEEALGKRSLISQMPEQAYHDRGSEWEYATDPRDTARTVYPN